MILNENNFSFYCNAVQKVMHVALNELIVHPQLDWGSLFTHFAHERNSRELLLLAKQKTTILYFSDSIFILTFRLQTIQ